MQVIIFFSLTRSNYLTPLMQGRSLGLATPLITAVSICFFLEKKCIYSVAERLYNHINQETFQTHAPASFQWQARVKQARKLAHTVLWRWGRLLPVINVFHFYYLLCGEASEGASGGEGRGVRGKRGADGEAGREEK